MKNGNDRYDFLRANLTRLIVHTDIELDNQLIKIISLEINENIIKQTH